MKEKKYLSLLVILALIFSASPSGLALETYDESVANALAHANDPANWVAADASIFKVSEAGSVGANPFALQFYGAPANNQLIVRTLSSGNAYNGAWGTLATAGTNYSAYGDKNSLSAWLTTGNGMTAFIDNKGLTAATVITGLERGLGMNVAGTHDAIFEMAVTVGNSGNNQYLLRPTRNPNPAFYTENAATYGTYASFPATAAEAGIGGANAETVYANYKAAYNAWVAKTYTTSKFPFSQLGYTYDWGQVDNPPTTLSQVQGMSEFILLGSTGSSNPLLTPSGTNEAGKVITVGIYATQSYLYTKNSGQYGNGYANFNVTGACNTLWAGAAFQTGASLNAATPNTVTIGAGGSVSGGQGILVGSQNYTVTNAGAITASAGTKKFNVTGSENSALLFRGTSAAYVGGVKNILSNSGTITGPGANGSAVVAWAGDTEITNTGTITGSGTGYAIKTAAGSDTVTVTGGTITGNIDLGTGTDSIAVNGGAVSGTGGLTKAGSGTLTLNGAFAYTGGTSVSGGALTLQFDTTNNTGVINSSSALTLGGAGTLNVLGGATAIADTQTFNGATLSGGQSTISLTKNSATSVSVAMGAITNSTQSYFNFTLPASGTVTASHALDLSGALLGTWASVGSGASLAYAASSNAVNGIITAYAGATPDAGDLASLVSATANYSYSAAATLAGDRTGNTLQYTGGATTTDLGANSLTLNGLMNSGTGLLTITGNASSRLMIGAGNELDLISNGQDIAISSIISGAGSVVYGGPSAGTLTLTEKNTYTGGTTVNGGTVIVNNSSNNGASVIGVGTLTINSGATVETTGAHNPFGYNAGTMKNIVINGGTLSLGVGTEYCWVDSITMTGGTISGAGGMDTEPFAGFTSTITANDSVTANVISITNFRLDTATTFDTVGAASLTVSSSLGQGLSQPASGSLTKTGDGTLTLSGTNTYLGDTKVNAGTLVLGNNLALQNSALDTSGAGVINVTGFTTPTLGGLKGSTNLASVITTGYSSMTALTLNPGTGVTDTYSGVIANGASGMTLTKSGLGTQVLSGANTYTGTTTISAGTLQVGSGGISGTLGTGNITNNAALIFNRSDALTVSNVISGSGTLEQAGGGTLSLNGANTYSGATLISAGTVAIGDSRALGAGGTANVTNNATLNIGSMTLNVGGTYSQGAASTLMVAVNGSSSGSVVVGGTAGTTGSYTVALNVSNFVPNNATYTIIDGAAGGTIGAPTITVSGDNHATFTATTVGEDLILTASRAANGFSSNATNSNGSSVGAVLDGITNPSGDMASVLNALEGLSGSAVGSALGTMTPDVSSGAADGSRSLTGQGFTTVSNRLGGARSGGASSGVSSGDMLNGVGVWMQALGSNMHQGERKGVEGYSGNTFGTTIGADKVIDDHFRAGFAGSYGWARVNSKTAGSPSDDINSFQGTVYGSFDSLDLNKARQGGKKSYEAVRSQVEKSWYVDGMFAFTQNNYDSRREIWVTPGSKRVAKAEHYAQQYSTNFEAGYKFVFEKTKALEITPFASLGYNFLYMNRYKEDGANALNLTVNGKGFNQLEQSLGTKLAYPIVAKKVGTFIPSAKAAWLYDYMADRFETTASFAGGGPSFSSQGAKPAKNGMLFGAELAFLNKGNVTLTGNWDIELKDQYMANTYYGTARYDF